MADINLGVGGANSAVAGGYTIDNSLKFEEDNLELLYKTFSGEGTGAGRTFTISTWCKRTELGGIDILFGYGRDANDYGDGGFRINSDQLQITSFPYSGGVDSYNIRSTAVFRDTSAWYHFMAAVDTTQGTASNRVRLYVNGTEITDFTTSDYPAQNFQWKVGRAEEHMIGNRPDTSATEGAGFSTQNFSGYMAEFHFVDGQQLAPTDFGEFDTDTGIWKPIAYTGSYGTNGFYLDFESSGSLGADGSGNSNNFTLSNITSADQATDTPTNNFAIYNVLNPTYGSCVINEGATQIEGDSTGSFRNVQSTLAVTSGKWYCELVPQLASTMNTSFGVVNLDTAVFDTTWYNNAGYWGGNFDSGASIYFFTNGGGAGSEPVSFSGTVGLAFDADNGTLDFYLNNSHQEQLTGIPSGTFAFFADVQGTGNPYIRYNFGGYTVNSISSAASDANGYGTFEYAPPSGYYALCSKNLAEFG